MAQAERKNKQASTVAKELSGMEGYPATVTFEEVCNAVGKSPSARAILTPDQQDEAAEKLKQTGAAPSGPSRRQRRSKKKSAPRRKARGTRQPRLTPEERAARQGAIDWLVSVQEECARLVQLEKDGTPYIPSMDELEQLPQDRTKVRFADPFASYLGDQELKRVLPFGAISDARTAHKNIPLFSSLLKERVGDALQALVPTVCLCGAPLRILYQVTEQDVHDFLRLRRQIPGGHGLRGPALHRYVWEDHHPECRYMEEEWVTLEFELSKMGGDTSEAVAFRQARYTALLDETLNKYAVAGATRESVLRAFEVFIQRKSDPEPVQASEVEEAVSNA